MSDINSTQNASKPDPLVTFVGYARNDGYAPSYLERLQLMIDVIAQGSARHQLACEILIVEWNPPADAERLANVLSLRHDSQWITVRIVTVPAERHQGFYGADQKGLHPSKALNVGYRRARGKFATPIASDTIINDEVFRYLASEELDTHKLYRLDRCDVSNEVFDKALGLTTQPEELYNLCYSNIVRRHMNQDDSLIRDLELPKRHLNAAGDFMLMSKENWHLINGQPEDCDVVALDIDSMAVLGTATHGIKEVRMPDVCVVYKFGHGLLNDSRVQPIWNWWSRRMSSLARLFARTKAKRAIWRGIFNVPKRSFKGVNGRFDSLERNILKYYWLPSWLGKPKKMSKKDWGLAGVELQDTYL